MCLALTASSSLLATAKEMDNELVWWRSSLMSLLLLMLGCDGLAIIEGGKVELSLSMTKMAVREDDMTQLLLQSSRTAFTFQKGQPPKF